MFLARAQVFYQVKNFQGLYKMKNHLAPYSFADGSVRSFEMGDNQILTVYIDSWDDRTIKLVFLNTLLLTYKSLDFISEFYELEDIDLAKILKDHSIQSSVDQLKLFQLRDISDQPLLEVVATSVEITKDMTIVIKDE